MVIFSDGKSGVRKFRHMVTRKVGGMVSVGKFGCVAVRSTNGVTTATMGQ